MRESRLQNRIAESTLTLPFAVFIGTLLWLLPWKGASLALGLSWGCALIATYAIAEMCSRSVLFRIRTRLSSSLWIVAASTLAFLHTDVEAAGVSMCFSFSLFAMLQGYQQPQEASHTFNALFFLSLSSLCCPLLIWLAGFYFFYIGFYLRAFSLRTFLAGVAGLLLPAWFLAGWCIWREDFSPLQQVLVRYLEWDRQSILQFLHIPLAEFLFFLFFSIVIILCSLHFLQTSYNESVRTRMSFHTLIFQSALTFLLILLQPVHLHTLLPMLIISGSPVITHYFASTRKVRSNVFFILCLLLLFVFAVLAVVL